MDTGKRKMSISRDFDYQYLLIRMNFDIAVFEINADSVFIQSLIKDYPEINNMITASEREGQLFGGKTPIKLIPKSTFSTEKILVEETETWWSITLKKKDNDNFKVRITRLPIEGDIYFTD